MQISLQSSAFSSFRYVSSSCMLSSIFYSFTISPIFISLNYLFLHLNPSSLFSLPLYCPPFLIRYCRHHKVTINSSLFPSLSISSHLYPHFHVPLFTDYIVLFHPFLFLLGHCSISYTFFHYCLLSIRKPAQINTHSSVTDSQLMMT